MRRCEFGEKKKTQGFAVGLPTRSDKNLWAQRMHPDEFEDMAIEITEDLFQAEKMGDLDQEVDTIGTHPP